MSARLRWVAAALVLLLAIGVGIAFVVTRDDRSTSATRPAPAPSPRPAVLSALDAAGGPPRAAAVALAVQAARRDPAFGGRLAAEVVDVATGAQLADVGADTALPPASTTKLLTATAALSVLGPQARLSTDVVRAGGTLYLVGGGDATLATVARRGGYPPTPDVQALATQAARAVPAARPLRLCLDTHAWQGPRQAPGWSAGYVAGGDIAPLSPLEVDEGEVRAGHRPRVNDPAAQAGAAFAAALRRHGVTTSYDAARPCRASAPSSGLGVASVASAPVAALVQRMLTDSDNDLAEALGRAIAVRTGHPATFAGEAAAVTAEMRALGLDTARLRLYDTSGLSRFDQVTARGLVDVVRLAAGPAHPELRPVLEGLPVAGFTGTLADRYRRGPAAAAAGVARAKTGTLAGVNTLAGTVVTRGGRLLAFALLTDRAAGPKATEAALDRAVGALAACCP